MSTIKPVAVRNVILVAGYDYEDPSRSFDAIALERIREIFDQEEHLRYPLRFHLFSAAQGIAAETVVFDKNYLLAKDEPLDILQIGKVWQRVDHRYARPSKDNYKSGSFRESPETDRGLKKVLSITDVYRYLYSFWETAQQLSPKDPVALDAIVELSFFAHASLSTISLLGSVDRSPRSPSRDPADKDARVRDFTGYSDDKTQSPREYFGRIRRVFDRSAGRIRIWGSDRTPDTDFYAGLIRAVLDAEKLLNADTSLLRPTLKADTPTPSQDPVVIERLGRAASSLTFSKVMAMLESSIQAGYASAIQTALATGTYCAPIGAFATTEKKKHAAKEALRLLFAVPESYADVVEFHVKQLKLTRDRENRRFVILGREPSLPKKGDKNTSPFAGVSFFRSYQYPFKILSPTGQIQREELQQHLNQKLEAFHFNKYGSRLLWPQLPAIAIVDVSGQKPPFQYASTPNDEDPHYAASMLKIAALFATAVLLRFTRDLKINLENRSREEVLTTLTSWFHGSIDRLVDFSGAKVLKEEKVPIPAILQWAHRTPHYDALFDEKSLSWNPSLAQRENIRRIFQAPSLSNAAARQLIHALGYAWINGVMQQSGFPDVWLAADFSRSTEWPSAKIPSVNDQLSGQVTTARGMATLFATLATGEFEETTIVREEYLPYGTGFISKHLADTGFTLLGAKVGLGPLKSGIDIFSEAAIYEKKTLGRKFVTIWLNAKSEDRNDIGSIVAETLLAYMQERG